MDPTLFNIFSIGKKIWIAEILCFLDLLIECSYLQQRKNAKEQRKTLSISSLRAYKFVKINGSVHSLKKLKL